jgi:hypothetical protein
MKSYFKREPAMTHFSKPVLLPGESEVEFLALRERIVQEIEPKGEIERICLDDILELLWEILRLRRYRTLIITNTIPAAIRNLYKQLGYDADFLNNTETETEATEMAKAYFHVGAAAKKKFMKVLSRAGLDGPALEAEAFRIAISDLERLDKMLAALERRRNKALRFIAEYRQGLAIQIRRVTDRTIAEVDGPRLEQPSVSLEHAD